MVESRILQALEQKDPIIRKKAIAALGKSHSSEALAVLGKVYKNDPDPEVRELARKAGVYLKKQLEEASPARPPSQPRRDGDSLSAEALIAAAQANKEAEAHARQVAEETRQEQIREAERQAERKAHPLYTKVMEADLDTFKITSLQKKKSSVALERALDFSMTKEHDLAREELRKAYDLNPALREDPYANSLVLQIVGGRDEDQALEALLNEAPLSKQKNTKQKAPSGHLFGALLLISGVVMIAGFLLPWIDFNPYDLEIAPDTPPMAFSGMDIFSNHNGVAHMFTVFDAVVDINQGIEPDLSLTRDIKTYSPILLVTGGIISILTGAMGLLGGVKRGHGFQNILAAVVGSGGLIWIYTTLDNFTSQFQSDPTLPFNPTTLLDMGFYVGAVGVGMAFLFGLVVMIRR